MEILQDVVIAPREIKTRASETIKFKVGHTVDEFGSFGGVGFYLFNSFVVFDASFEVVAETDRFSNVNPVFFAKARHFGYGGFARGFEIIVPYGGNGFVVIIPEFAFFLGTVGGNGRMTGVDRVGFAVFVKKVREADFEEDVVIFDILPEIVFVFDNGVFKSDTIRTN